jgi:hypothetical protein
VTKPELSKRADIATRLQVTYNGRPCAVENVSIDTQSGMPGIAPVRMVVHVLLPKDWDQGPVGGVRSDA